jgi:hypothetical protein
VSELKKLESAVDDYIKAKSEEDGTFVTGWVMVASLSSPDHDSTHTDGYVTVSSEGLPHHAQVGLLKVSLDDKQAMSMFNAMGAIAINLDGEDDEDVA